MEEPTEQHLAPGISILGFKSMDQMTEYNQRQEEAAVAQTVEEQWRITYGSRVVRFVEGLVIWGAIFTEDEILGDNPTAEDYSELDMMRDAHNRGYRYGKWFSVVEPTGEYGSAHVCSLWEIPEEDFETALDNGWKITTEQTNRFYNEIAQASSRRTEENR